jgi:DeoR/GlpR family transcriptional regulator of sugar metabolism
MFGAARLEGIASLLRQRRTVSIAELTEMFAASEATIRRDLTKLEKRGLLKRTYGGAISLYSSSLDAPASVRELHRVPEKRAIALAAAELVSDGETIVLDAGTTTAQLARVLRNRRKLTVITNSGQVMNELYDCDGVSVIATGGVLFPLGDLQEQGDLIMTGPVAEATLRRFRPSKAFLGTAGITLSEGMTNTDLPQAQIKQLMIEIADEVILLTDCTKFGHVSYSITAPVDVLDKVITDECIEPEDRSWLEERGIDVIVVEPVTEEVRVT